MVNAHTDTQLLTGDTISLANWANTYLRKKLRRTIKSHSCTNVNLSDHRYEYLAPWRKTLFIHVNRCILV